MSSEIVPNYELFDKSIRGLCKLMAKVFTEREKNRVSLSGQPNPVLTSLNVYKDKYESSGEAGREEHVQLFRELYSKHRSNILRGYLSDSWLLKNDNPVSVSLTSRRNARLALSLTYDLCCKARDEAEKRLEGMPESCREDCIEVLYPEVFLLHLYRIFKDAVSTSTFETREKDTEVLTQNIQKLEQMLDNPSQAQAPATTSSTPAPATSGSVPNPPANLSVEGLMGMLSQLTGGNGQLNPDSLGKAIGSVFQHPDIQDAVGTFIPALKGQNLGGLADMIPKLLNQDPAVMSEMQKTFAPIMSNMPALAGLQNAIQVPNAPGAPAPAAVPAITQGAAPSTPASAGTGTGEVEYDP